MKGREKIEGYRTDYMTAMTELGTLAIDRGSHLPLESGLSALRSVQDAEESRNAVTKINQQVAETCNRARAIEQLAHGCIGVPALFGVDIPNAIRVVVAILLGKSLAGTWTYESKNVGALLLPASGGNADDMIVAREAFSSRGILRKHIHCELGRTIDETDKLSLTESAFRTLLALEPDSECEDLIQARSLASTNGRR